MRPMMKVVDKAHKAELVDNQHNSWLSISSG